MTEEQEERFVSAFEQIATALTGIHDNQEKQFAKQWPERKEVHEAVYSRVPTEEDLIREAHGGASAGSTEEWLTLLEREEYIGQREREFLAAQTAAAASAKTSEESGPEGGSTEAPEDQAGDASIGAGDHTTI
jgi:hypothetical protein